MINFAALGASLGNLFPQKSNTANPNGSTKRKKNPTTAPAVSDATSTTSQSPSPLGGFDMENFNTKNRQMFAGILPILAAMFAAGKR